MTDHVATSDIEFGEPGRGVYAFRAGQRVPAELVKANKWEEHVASPTSKAGQEAVASAAGSADATPAAAATAAATSTKGGAA